MKRDLCEVQSTWTEAGEGNRRQFQRDRDRKRPGCGRCAENWNNAAITGSGDLKGFITHFCFLIHFYFFYWPRRISIFSVLFLALAWKCSSLNNGVQIVFKSAAAHPCWWKTAEVPQINEHARPLFARLTSAVGSRLTETANGRPSAEIILADILKRSMYAWRRDEMPPRRLLLQTSALILEVFHHPWITSSKLPGRELRRRENKRQIDFWAQG